MKIQPIKDLLTFKSMPYNYTQIDENVSRSAQPTREDYLWLKRSGVTDVINFRTLWKKDMSFDEASWAEFLGIRYHHLPSVSAKPDESKIKIFLEMVNSIVEQGGRVHIHCKAGADRTGMYSFVYKAVKGIGTMAENEREWLARGLNVSKYPDLMEWTKAFLKKVIK